MDPKAIELFQHIEANFNEEVKLSEQTKRLLNEKGKIKTISGHFYNSCLNTNNFKATASKRLIYSRKSTKKLHLAFSVI